MSHYNICLGKMSDQSQSWTLQGFAKARARKESEKRDDEWDKRSGLAFRS